MGVAASLTVSGLPEIQRTLQGLQAFGKNPSVPLRASAVSMMKSVDQTFREEGAPDAGVIWEPMSTWTLNRRRARAPGTGGGTGAKRLQDTGRLRMSLVVPKAPGNVQKFTAKEAAIGTNVEYAGIQQFGGWTKAWSGLVRVKGHTRQLPGGGTTTVAPHDRLQVLKPHRIPARPFLMFKPSDALRIGKIFAAYLEKVITQAGNDLTAGELEG